MKDVDIVMAHRYLYYVKSSPVISDRDYDRLEAPIRHRLPAVGSDREEDYTEDQIKIAEALLL